MRSISRRSMLGGMAGAAALAAIPELFSVQPAAAAATSGTKGLVGASVFTNAYPNVTDRVVAGDEFDGFVGRPACRNVQRVYFQESQFPDPGPAGDNHPQPVRELTDNGIKMVISFHPSPSLLSTDRTSLHDALVRFQGFGANFEVALWHEANHDLGTFPTPDSYHQFVAYYAPAVRAAGVKLAYIPILNGNSSAVDYYPGPSLADKILVDYYGNAYLAGVRLADIMAVADGVAGSPVPVASTPKPFGISEWGASAGQPLSPADFDKFVNYIVAQMTARLTAGKTNAEIIWFDGGGDNNNITTTTDFKIPGFQAVYDALNR